MTVDAELLQAGSDNGQKSQPGRRARWSVWLIALAALVSGIVVVALAIIEVAPSLGGRAATQLQLLVVGPKGLYSIDVDGGQVRQFAGGVGAVAAGVQTAGDLAVVQIPNDDQIFADSVRAYSKTGSVTPIGEADRVVPNPNGGLWLIVDSSDGVEGGAALASATGGWRSRVFSVPANRQVVGAANDGLVTLKGGRRDRTLQLWDPQLREVVRTMGLVSGVLAVENSSILVSRGCLSKGCVIAVVDGVTGIQTPVSLPAGWRESGPMALSPDGTWVAQVVASTGGAAALAFGPPSNLQIDDTVQPGVGSSVVISDDGWLVLTRADGDAVVLRGSQQRAVEIPAGAQVVGVSSVH